jgi:hypothetical protein
MPLQKTCGALHLTPWNLNSPLTLQTNRIATWLLEKLGDLLYQRLGLPRDFVALRLALSRILDEFWSE